jgi:hypothetical protein
VELSFQTLELREICEKRETAVASLGSRLAQELERCLADLEAVGTVAEFAQLYPDLLSERSTTARLVRIGKEAVLVFRSGHITMPTNSEGHADWARVRRIKIIALETEHD